MRLAMFYQPLFYGPSQAQHLLSTINLRTCANVQSPHQPPQFYSHAYYLN